MNLKSKITPLLIVLIVITALTNNVYSQKKQKLPKDILDSKIAVSVMLDDYNAATKTKLNGIKKVLLEAGFDIHLIIMNSSLCMSTTFGQKEIENLDNKYAIQIIATGNTGGMISVFEIYPGLKLGKIDPNRFRKGYMGKTELPFDYVLEQLITDVNKLKESNSGINTSSFNSSKCKVLSQFPTKEMTELNNLPKDLSSETLYVPLSEKIDILPSFTKQQIKTTEKVNKRYEAANQQIKNSYKKYPYSVKFFHSNKLNETIKKGARYFHSNKLTSGNENKKVKFEQGKAPKSSTNVSYHVQPIILDFVDNKIYKGEGKTTSNSFHFTGGMLLSNYLNKAAKKK